MKTNTYNQKHQQTGYLFVSSISEEGISVGIISRRTSAVDSLISSYLKAIGVTLLHTSVDEITPAGMKSMLRNADRGGFIDDDEVLERFGLDSIRNIIITNLHIGSAVLLKKGLCIHGSYLP